MHKRTTITFRCICIFCLSCLLKYYPLVVLTNIPKERSTSAQGLLSHSVVNILLQLKLVVKFFCILLNVDVQRFFQGLQLCQCIPQKLLEVYYPSKSFVFLNILYMSQGSVKLFNDRSKKTQYCIYSLLYKFFFCQRVNFITSY